MYVCVGRRGSLLAITTAMMEMYARIISEFDIFIRTMEYFRHIPSKDIDYDYKTLTDTDEHHNTRLHSHCLFVPSECVQMEIDPKTINNTKLYDIINVLLLIFLLLLLCCCSVYFYSFARMNYNTLCAPDSLPHTS